MTRQKFVLPELDYPYDALEPHIDRKTMEIHLTKHHNAYVTNLNAALEKQQIDGLDLKKILAQYADEPAIRNNGGGHFNHTFFWKLLVPKAKKEPTGSLLKAIQETFGSFDAFKQQFATTAAGRFGSGWAWLVADQKKKLHLFSTANQDVPFLSVTGGIDGSIPLIGLDVWEHAYYLHYQNRRPDYIAAFWNVINWEKAEAAYTH